MKKQITIIKPPTIDVERLPINKKVFQALDVDEQRDQLRKHYGPYAKDLPYETKLAEQLDVPNKHSGSRHNKREWENTRCQLVEFKHQDELHRRFNITRPYLYQQVKALAKTERLATNSGTWRADAERILADKEPLPYGKLYIKERGYDHELMFKIEYETAHPIWNNVRPCDAKLEKLEEYEDGWKTRWGERLEGTKEECHDVIEHFHRLVVMCLILSQSRQLLKANLGDDKVAPGIHLEPINYEPMHKYG